MGNEDAMGRGSWMARVSAWRGLPLALGFAIALLVALGSLLAAYVIRDHGRIQERTAIAQELGVLRSRLEAALSSRLLLGRGLVSYIQVHPRLDGAEFQAYASRLVGRDPVIRNISLIRDTTVMDSYPRMGNEKVIGVDLAIIPGQGAALRRVIESRKIVIDGPLDLVQGGRGLVSRMPIFEDVGTYWGQASLVLTPEALLAEAGLANGAHGLDMALRVKTDGVPRAAFWGRDSVYGRDPVRVEIIFPTGAWELAATPVRGWGQRSFGWVALLVAGGLLALGSGLLVHRILSDVRRIHALESILPICASCKKIRDDQGYWEQVESYLSTVSSLRFSHGLCPDCARRLYDWKDGDGSKGSEGSQAP